MSQFSKASSITFEAVAPASTVYDPLAYDRASDSSLFCRSGDSAASDRKLFTSSDRCTSSFDEVAVVGVEPALELWPVRAVSCVPDVPVEVRDVDMESFTFIWQPRRGLSPLNYPIGYHVPSFTI
jgi:hypothetical protein